VLKNSLWEFFTARPKTLFRVGSPRNPAQAETEDSSKIKDRLEALLFAETLQGTLSPNANPGKGSVGGLLNWMPKATARIQRAAQTLVHLSSTRSFIPNQPALRKGRIRKVTGGYGRISERQNRDREKSPDPIFLVLTVRGAHPSKTLEARQPKLLSRKSGPVPKNHQVL
jgi:hypothetical protein